MLGIISWLTNIAKALGYWFQEIFKEAIRWTTKIWALQVLIAGLCYTALNDTVGAINTILDLVSGADSTTASLTPSGTNVTWLLSVCNTFAPMDELFAYAGTYLVLMGAFGLYRLIKSWIPGGFAGGS